MENQPLFNTTQTSLNLCSKRRTFPKLGLGISEIDKRMSWRRRRYRTMTMTITLQFQPNKLESKLKGETFPKLGLGYF